jgi:calcineurin-like phosphoesterase
MCGDYNSIIGMDRDKALQRFFKHERGERLVPSNKVATISGVRIVADEQTGLAKEIEPIIIGGNLTKKFN